MKSSWNGEMKMGVDPTMIPPGYISQFSIGSVVCVIQCQNVRNHIMLRRVVSQIMFVTSCGCLNRQVKYFLSTQIKKRILTRYDKKQWMFWIKINYCPLIVEFKVSDESWNRFILWFTTSRTTNERLLNVLNHTQNLRMIKRSSFAMHSIW